MSDFKALREEVCEANLALVQAGLVVLTWGNVSGADRERGVMAIKPSGVDYRTLTPDHIPVLDIASGAVVYGSARPSSDTPTHLHLYRAIPAVGGVAHTHSTYGTSFAQARHTLPCLGTTHADNFHGAIPCTRLLDDAEIETDYELNTGKVIVEMLDEGYTDPMSVPGILVAGHAPFTWGPSAHKAVENAIVLELSAQMTVLSMSINPQVHPISRSLLDKHFLRKHGQGAYYGQPKTAR